jgi:hypothetical protein
MVSNIRQQVIWQQMKAKMKEGRLQTVVISEKEVIWMDKHEIWVNEMMFDIHSKELKDGMFIFKGMYDLEETILVKKQKATSEKNAESHKLLTQFFQYLHTIYYKYTPDVQDFNGPSPELIIFPIPLPVHPFIPLLTPPPQPVIT